MAKGKHAKKTRKKHVFLKIFILLVLVCALLLVDSNVRPVLSEYEVSLSSLPKSFDGVRIVQLSDLHATEYGENNEKLVSKIRALQPSLIAITGDMIDAEGQDGYVRTLIPQLLEIAPVYYVTGNHEWASGAIKEMFSTLKELGVSVLRNDYDVLRIGDDSIILAGAEDPNGPYDMETKDSLVNRIRQAEGGKTMIMLYHRNDKLSEFASLGVDLVLSGHAHGGLIRLPFTDGLVDGSRTLFPTHTAGEYSEGGTKMIVSRGLGNTGRTFRFLNNPDIVSITLRAE